MRKIILLILCVSFCLTQYGQTAADRSLKVTVNTNSNPTSLTLRWQKGLNAVSYTVERKSRFDTSWTMLTNSLGVNDTFYIDNNVSDGIGYEYNVRATSNIAPFTAYSYLYCGNKIPVKHQQGKIILLVDNTYSISLSSEIKRLENDLINDGWLVIRKDISRAQSVKSVKQFIVSTYLSDTLNVKGIFMLGHIPVPYSGYIYPDGHDEHHGAWPADAYYCDTSFAYWTDATVNNASASRTANKNIPGDGKFDPSFTNRPFVKLFSGRVDMFDMPAINSNDVTLMRQYLDKNHRYRTARKKFRMRGLIDDNLGYFSGEAFASNGWRNFSTLLTPDSVSNGQYDTDMKTGSYLWSYGCGSGSYESASGVTTTTELKSLQLQSVFTMSFGSYFGDWDSQNNFLRAPLASNSDFLVSCWAGRPNWYFHHMALGEPIGLDAFESCVNKTTYQPPRHGQQMVHQALLGDPTLRMYVYEPPSNFTVKDTNNTTTAKLSWTPSPSSGILGYYVYKARSLQDSFVLLTKNYLTTTSYNDHDAGTGKNIYLVRAVKLQSSATGSFYNLSPGVIDSINFTVTTPTAVNYFTGEKSTAGNKLNWMVNCTSNNTKIELQKSKDKIHYDSIYSLVADSFPCQNNFGFTDALNIQELNYYRLKITDINGNVSYSNIVTLVNSNRSIIFEKTPVASDHELILQIAAPENTTIKAIISDAVGRRMDPKTLSIAAGSNTIRINYNNLPKGVYYFSCFAKDQKVLTKGFVIR
ncbi:hypothetical protein ACQ33O_07825 [Ferruginibacter sp. SUN002]|uniref:hypothetical protein n=1 Tax=Ferruginibacter sp. SUN002 TaxID=2937789 RepID=UPI003D36736D